MTKWNCERLEARLDDYLEGRLAAADLQAADAHARSCSRCAEWFDARCATLWLRRLEPLEAPPGLETRILAQTVAPPPRESLWAVLGQGWTLVSQPRFAFGLAAAVFSAALALSALDVSLRDVRAADLNPANIYRAVNRQAHQTYARGTRFVNELRLVYEIRTRLEAFRSDAEPPAPQPPPDPGPGEQPKPDDGNSVSGTIGWLYAYHQMTLVRTLR
ncbi:MAG: hypothetical protein ACE1Z8_03060 [Candidatus Acidiferrales bacterium]